jgi:ribosomal protein S11
MAKAKASAAGKKKNFRKKEKKNIPTGIAFISASFSDF